MSLMTQARMAEDNNLMKRIAAQAARLGVEGNPITWASRHQWQLASSPSWVSMYDNPPYIEETTTDQPSDEEEPDSLGADERIISDGMIESAVRELLFGPDPSQEEEEEGE